MKIIKLTLCHYKRFPLIGKSTIVFDFKNKLSLILGTNGSGKSSLMKELSPLPSVKEDFYSDGYKEIIIEHKSNIYTLMSDFRQGQSYSFKFNDEELNISKNITTQKVLVENHFNLNQDLFDILIGVNTFTSMTVAQRKKIFNQISNSNINEILSMYEYLQQSYRDNELIIKTNSSLLYNEKSKLINDEDKIRIEEELKQIDNSIDFLLQFRQNLSLYKENNTNVEEIIRNFTTVRDKLLKYYRNNYYILTSHPAQSREVIDEWYNTNLNSYNAQIKEKQELLEKLDSSLRAIEIKKKENRDVLEKKISELKPKINQLYHSINYISLQDYNSFYNAYTIFYNNYSNLKDSISNIEPNEYSKPLYIETKEDLIKYKEKLSTLQSRLSIIDKKIQHNREHKIEKNLTCPHCNNKFNYTFTLEDEDKLLIELKELQKNIEILENIIKERENLLKKIETYYENLKVYLQIRQGIREVFVNAIDEIDKNIQKNPQYSLAIIDKLLCQCSDAKIYFDYKRELSELENTLSLIEKHNNTDETLTKNYYNNSIDEYNHLIKLKLNLHKKYEHKLLIKTMLDEYGNLCNELNKVTQTLNTTLLSYTIEQLIETIDKEVRNLKLQHIELSTRLKNNNDIINIIKNYETVIQKYQTNNYVLKVMIDNLSPKTGLIAKTIGVFINNFIHHINDFISQIWSYPFTIVPYEIESEEKFDYRFRVISNDKHTSTDISKTSSGMREIIDLSFKLSLMQLLDMNDYPLYLDEFGTRLDIHHRSNIYNRVFSFILDNFYSQIFMITHTDTGFANIKNTTVYSLDTDNITYKIKSDSMKIMV